MAVEKFFSLSSHLIILLPSHLSRSPIQWTRGGLNVSRKWLINASRDLRREKHKNVYRDCSGGDEETWDHLFSLIFSLSLISLLVTFCGWSWCLHIDHLLTLYCTIFLCVNTSTVNKKEIMSKRRTRREMMSTRHCARKQALSKSTRLTPPNVLLWKYRMKQANATVCFSLSVTHPWTLTLVYLSSAFVRLKVQSIHRIHLTVMNTSTQL